MPLAALLDPFLARPSLCALEALRAISGGETMTTSAAAGTTLRTHVSQGYPCSAHRLLSWVGAPSLLGAGPSLCRFASPQRLMPSPGRSACVVFCVHVHQHTIPDGRNIPRRRSWPYRGGAMPNFVMAKFPEVRISRVLGSGAGLASGVLAQLSRDPLTLYASSQPRRRGPLSLYPGPAVLAG